MNQIEFNLPEAIRLRDKGIERVSGNNVYFLNAARNIARDIARDKGEVTADDVRKVCLERDIEPTHPNAYGAIFRKGFVFTGQVRQSTVVSRRAGIQRVWKLK